jgi:hypothetical protein
MSAPQKSSSQPKEARLVPAIVSPSRAFRNRPSILPGAVLPRQPRGANRTGHGWERFGASSRLGLRPGGFEGRGAGRRREYAGGSSSATSFVWFVRRPVGRRSPTLRRPPRFRTCPAQRWTGGSKRPPPGGLPRPRHRVIARAGDPSCPLHGTVVVPGQRYPFRSTPTTGVGYSGIWSRIHATPSVPAQRSAPRPTPILSRSEPGPRKAPFVQPRKICQNPGGAILAPLRRHTRSRRSQYVEPITAAPEPGCPSWGPR